MRLLTKLSLCGALVLGAASAMDAQDVRYSQYYSAPLRLNPAMIGMFEGKVRVGINYRSQWGAVLNKAYKSFAATGDVKIPVAKHDYFAAGLTAMTDFSGVGNYNTTEVNVGAAFHKKLNKARRGYSFNKFESSLIAGVQLGFGQRRVNWDNLTYSNQWDPDNGTYDPTQYSGEDQPVRAARTYVDINAGLMWAATFGKRRSLYLGGAVHHVNRPDISLFALPAQDSMGNSIGTGKEPLYMRWVAHAGGEILLGQNKSPMSLLPGLVAMVQGPSTELSLGLSLRYQAPSYDDFAFRLGVWTRIANQLLVPDTTGVGVDSYTFSPDAVIFMFGMDYKTLQLGLSYDLSVSSIKTATNGRGAMEVSLFYRFGYDGKRPQGCPVFN